MDDEDYTRELCKDLLLLADAFQLSMSRVSTILEEAVDLIEHLTRTANNNK